MGSIGVTEVLLFLGGQAIVAAAIWGGIRADIRGMHVRIEAVKEIANSAHRRLDDHMQSILNSTGTRL